MHFYVLWIKGNSNKANLTRYLTVAYFWLLQKINWIAKTYLIRMYRDLGLRWPRFTSEPRMKSVLGKLKTGVGVVLAAPTQSNCGDAAECLMPEKGLLHFTVTGSLESLLKFKWTIPNWLEHMPKETNPKRRAKISFYGEMPEPLSPSSNDYLVDTRRLFLCYWLIV